MKPPIKSPTERSNADNVAHDERLARIVATLADGSYRVDHLVLAARIIEAESARLNTSRS